MNRNQPLIKPIGPEPDRSSPAYLHLLVCEAAAKGTLIILTSEPEPLTLSLIAGTWHSLETIGEVKETPEEYRKRQTAAIAQNRHSSENQELERHEPGTGHDCLVIQTPGGVETELTVAQTAELIKKLEILLGKEKANLIEIASPIPLNLKTQ